MKPIFNKNKLFLIILSILKSMCEACIKHLSIQCLLLKKWVHAILNLEHSCITDINNVVKRHKIRLWYSDNQLISNRNSFKLSQVCITMIYWYFLCSRVVLSKMYSFFTIVSISWSKNNDKMYFSLLERKIF